MQANVKIRQKRERSMYGKVVRGWCERVLGRPCRSARKGMTWLHHAWHFQVPAKRLFRPWHSSQSHRDARFTNSGSAYPYRDEKKPYSEADYDDGKQRSYRVVLPPCAMYFMHPSRMLDVAYKWPFPFPCVPLGTTVIWTSDR